MPTAKNIYLRYLKCLGSIEIKFLKFDDLAMIIIG